ncbi:MAG: hypothetical protein V2J65_06265 [Desulfobacteraceae bacterium]|jgi:hypothetical protein|nr:hypothetical protein [Desulfobacteraceae bacterium]
MDDNSHEPDQDRRSFLIKVMAGGSILLSLLLSALLNWLMGKIQELRRKQKQERYKASPIYPYRKGCCERVIFFWNGCRYELEYGIQRSQSEKLGMVNIALFGVKFHIRPFNTKHAFAMPIFSITYYLIFAPLTFWPKICPGDI